MWIGTKVSAEQSQPGRRSLGHTNTRKSVREPGKVQEQNPEIANCMGFMQLQEKPLQPETKEISLCPDLKGLFFSETSEADRERH